MVTTRPRNATTTFAMKILSLLISSLSAYNALEMDTNVHQLLLSGVGEVALKEILKSLMVNHDTQLPCLLGLASCEFFDFSPFMTANPVILKPLINSLRKKNYSREVAARFYNFNELQLSEAGRRFLIESDVNFAKFSGWNSALFTPSQVRRILLKIQSLPPSQIDHVDPRALSQALMDDKSNFFGENGRWNMFPLASLLYYYNRSKVISSWLDQVEPYVATEDLLFYRLAYLSRHYQEKDPILVRRAKELLAKTASLTKFRLLVFDFYCSERLAYTDEYVFFDIPNSIVGNSAIHATIHFEHLCALFEIDYGFSLESTSKLFQIFSPNLVPPFICRKLLEWVDSERFLFIFSKASQEWERVYVNPQTGPAYFPMKFLPKEIQLKLWRYDLLRIMTFLDLDASRLTLNHPQSWQHYIGDDYMELKKRIAYERDGFTFIDCHADKRLIKAFIEGRIVEYLLGISPSLPSIMPIRQEWILPDEKDQLEYPENFCIKKPGEQPTIVKADRSLRVIKETFEAWNVSDIVLRL